jgi:hypothetical protein
MSGRLAAKVGNCKGFGGSAHFVAGRGARGSPIKYQDDIAKIEGAKAQTLIDETRAELRRLEMR